MRTLLYINDTICSSLEQLRGIVSSNLIPNTPVYEDLLTLQRDGELAQWLAEGSTEEIELSKALGTLSPELSNSELMQGMIGIILGVKVDAKKPSYSSFFSITNFSCRSEYGTIVFSESGHYSNNIVGLLDYTVLTKTATYCQNTRLRPFIPELNVFEFKFFIDMKIKKTDKESFRIRLLDDDGYELGANVITLYDKFVGQIVHLVIDAIIDIGCKFSLKADDDLIYNIEISKGFISKVQFSINNVLFNMIYVEGGTFMMGNDYDYGYFDTRPKHPVTLNSFYIGETVVTQELWEAVMNNNPSTFIGLKNPVETVRWDDCQQFLDKLNILTNMKFRLPTEAEWEYAAREGKRHQLYNFSGSNYFDEVANQGNKSYPVAMKNPNELGIYDMSGNVREWCQDWYDDNYYKVSPEKNPTGPLNSEYHVNRGGGWADGEERCSVTHRGYLSVEGKSHYIGFRIAL